MKTVRLLLITLSIGLLLSAMGCSKGGGSSTPDPQNTVEAWIPIGRSIAFGGRYLVMTDQKVFRASEINQMEFTVGLPVKGLSSINSIPKSGYAWWSEVKPGCGYVIHLTADSYYGFLDSWARLYVVDFTYNEAHSMTGVNVKYELGWWPD